MKSIKNRILAGSLSIVITTISSLILINYIYLKNRDLITNLAYNIEYIHNDLLKLIIIKNDFLHSELSSQNAYSSGKSIYLEKYKNLSSSLNSRITSLAKEKRTKSFYFDNELLAIRKSLKKHEKFLESIRIKATEQFLLTQNISQIPGFIHSLDVYNQLNSEDEKIESLITGINNNVQLKKKKLLRKYYYSYLLLTIGTILLSLILNLIFSSSVSKPLKILSDDIQKMAKNKFRIKINKKQKLNRIPLEVESIYEEFKKLSTEFQQHENQRNEALHCLMIEEQRYREMAELSPLSIFETDFSGRLTFVNRTMLQKFSFLNHEWKDKTLFEIVESKEKALYIKNQAYLENYEFEARKPDGSTFPALLYFTQTKTGKNAGGFRGVIVDITARMKYINALKREKKRAEESDQLKTAFLANVSHEIRTPLNGIMGFAELLSSELENKEESELYIEQIKQSSEVLLNLISDILDIAKIETGEIPINVTKFNVNSVLVDIFKNFNEAPETRSNNVHLKLDVKSDEEILLYSDRNKLIQILNNLISNAIKFTEKGEILICYTIIDNNIEFKVKDSGIGIPKEKQHVIFERFRQADDSITRKYGGTGLGLAITKSLVEILGGTICVNSKINEGSEFIFTIPYSPNEDIGENISFHKGKNSQHGKAYDFKGYTFLIAEDDMSNFTYIKKALRLTGAEIIHACDGMEAITKYNENPSIDLVLMDLNMPRMNGNEATRYIRETNKEIPIIVQTAYALSSEKEEAFNAGCNDYITKPILKNLLLDKVNYHLIQNDKNNFIGESIQQNNQLLP